MRRLSRVVLAAASVVVAALAIEGLLRASGYGYSPVTIGAGVADDWREEHAFQDRNLTYDPVLIWRPKSGQFSPFNPQGFRGAPVVMPKPAGTYRVFALGDSNTFGWDVDDGVNWPAQLHRLMSDARPGAEVVNAGVWGYASFQGARRFHELLEYAPDLVLVSFGANDAHRVRVADVDYVARHERVQWLTRATRRLRLAQLLVQGWDALGVATSARDTLRPRVTLPEYEGYLREMIAAGRARNAEVVLLTRPFVGSSTDPASWKTYAPAYNAATLAVGREQEVEVIDLYTAFKDRPERFDDESHFGVEGHRLAAELIHARLTRRVAR